MNFLNIKYFLTIAEEKSISAAARKLYVSQQSLSEHLKKLENELGVPLFERGGTLRLTVAGECFLEGSKELITTYNRMLSNIDAVTVRRRSKIAIGVPTYGEPPYLADLLVRYNTAYPQYEVSVVKRLHSDISHNMNGVDLYLSWLPLDEDLESVPILDPDPYCVFFRRSLAERIYANQWPSVAENLSASHDLSLLSEMPFLLLYDRLGHLSSDIDRIFKQFQFTPLSGFASENYLLNADLCLRGTGCLLGTSSFIRHYYSRAEPSLLRDMLCYPLEVTGFRPLLAVCYQKGKHLHDAEICFIKEMSDFLANG